MGYSCSSFLAVEQIRRQFVCPYNSTTTMGLKALSEDSILALVPKTWVKKLKIVHSNNNGHVTLFVCAHNYKM